MSYSKVPLGESAPEKINAVIEIVGGSNHKYEYDEKLEEIKLDRVLHSTVFYPSDYGFIPQTRAEDGDHLDILVIISGPTFPGCVLSVRPIGVLDMEDNAGKDWKIIAVADRDPRFADLNSIERLEEHLKKEIWHFFETYKQLENKQVKVNGWLNKKESYRIIRESKERFEKES